ncbi:hypothetical protein [Chitinophaga sp. Cy-1792]|uniref:hypothetical protein n=1 Tax=Chitinophaga sp. Cy-1792 TaxID=2608339 RepID=UPI001423213A|nr:hypothetical protein [Chitinophaga sp. Cy-1792]NIG55201.1 hypothetical protein [Chitinophaga sp. Cy-1792]
MQINYRWKNVTAGFNMPVAAMLRGKTTIMLFPTTAFATLRLKNTNNKDFQVDDQYFLMSVEH